MKEHPILFSGEMVRAILEGRKTQTRRVIRPQPNKIQWNPIMLVGYAGWTDEHGTPYPCPYGQPGDRLWVRETWAINQCGSRVPLCKEARPDGFPINRLRYPATDTAPHIIEETGKPHWWNKRPSIHMPRWASRITLEVVDVRVERVQEITLEDCRAEGIKYLINPGESRTWEGEFERTWDTLNAKRGYGWETNPFVWVVEFKVLPAGRRAIEG